MLYKKDRPKFMECNIPAETYNEYFYVMQNKLPLYLCILSGTSGPPRLYLEKDKDKKIDGIVRMFYSKEDIEHYMDIVAHEERIPAASVKYWDTTADEIVSFLSKLDEKHKQSGKSGIRVMVSIFYNMTMTDIDVFWTAEKNFMV